MKIKERNAVDAPEKMSRGRTVLWFVIGFMVTVFILLLLIPMTLFIKYNQKTYEEQKPVVREETYVAPAPPEIIIDVDGSWQENEEVVEDIPEDINSDPIFETEKKEKTVRNILVLGTDSRDLSKERGRSDTMIVFSYNSETGKVKMASLMRDSLVPIEGHGWNRLNAAYSLGGVGLAINTINEQFDLDIQEYVIVDFNSVQNFIDYIGGVDLVLSDEEAKMYSSPKGTTYSAGLNHLDGAAALRHMRNRSIGMDFGRTRRQRDTIAAVIRKILNEKSVTEIYEITDYAFTIAKTNITSPALLKLVASAVSQKSNLKIETQNVPFNDDFQFGWYNKMAIINFDIESAAKRLNTFLYEE